MQCIGACVVTFAGAVATISASVPPLLSIQGLAQEASGTPIADGNYTFQFSIYDDMTAGSLLWSETQPSVLVSGGLFNAVLGISTALPDSVFGGTTRWLQVTIGANPPLSRVRLLTSPYSFRTASVDGATGGTISSDVSIGEGHTNTGADAFVAGLNNTVSGDASTVAGGSGNTASGFRAAVGGGQSNRAEASGSVVGGGQENVTNGDWSSIAGGWGNAAHGPYNTISGGEGNITDNSWTAISGGHHNWAGAGGCVVGGRFHAAGGLYSFIGGGTFNRAWGQYSVVAGGGGDAITDSNSATGNWSTISGGRRNVTSALGATVSGGQTNTASASFATVPGGVFNTASGRFSLAAGRHAAAAHDGSFVWADSLTDLITSPAVNTFSVRASGGIWLGTNSTPSVPDGDFISTSTGAHLTTGGVWTNSSDRSAKENFTEVDRDDLLWRISTLPIMRWNYKTEDDSVTHIGPIAQDFRILFGVGTDDKSISTVDPSGIALAAIQALYSRNQKLEAAIARLQSEVEALKTSGNSPRR